MKPLIRRTTAFSAFLLSIFICVYVSAADTTKTSSRASASGPSKSSWDNAKRSPLSLDSQTLALMMDSLDDKQKIGAGDKVTYRVIEDQDDPVQLTVTETGDLEVPYYGLVPASGKTCKQLAKEIKELLEKHLYYRATVIISLDQMNRKRILGRVYLVGQVKQNGPQDIPGDEEFTVSKAILRAGGFSDFADKKKVKIVRAAKPGEQEKQIIVNVAEIFEKGKLENDIKLEPDDLIFVPARLVNF